MGEPKQKRGRSKQDYATPWEFIRAVEARFGKIVCDLAANADNAKCTQFITEAEDSWRVAWAERFPKGVLWLNPPFGNIEMWARKCALEARWRSGLIVMLTPASIDSRWFEKYVNGKARVMPVAPRVPFEGGEPNPKTGKFDGYPKSLMLSVFGRERTLEHYVKPPENGFDIFRWRAVAAETTPRLETKPESDRR